jgi:hypothetical protein
MLVTSPIPGITIMALPEGPTAFRDEETGYDDPNGVIESRHQNEAAGMQTAKEQAKALIDKLPDHATLNDIMYELYVKQKIEAGMQASREGRVTPHAEIKKRYLGRGD